MSTSSLSVQVLLIASLLMTLRSKHEAYTVNEIFFHQRKSRILRQKRAMMIFLRKLLILMLRSRKTGMKKKMVSGQHHPSLILTTRTPGPKRKLRIPTIRGNGSTYD